jgi:integrase
MFGILHKLPDMNNLIPNPPLKTHGMITDLRSDSIPKISLTALLRQECQLRHFSRQTFDAYAHWLRRYYLFHGRRPPRELGPVHIREFLTALAKQNLSASSQNQALNALVFVYQRLLKVQLGDIGEFLRAKRSRKVPVVLSTEEVHTLLSHLHGTFRLMAQLIYGTGIRLNECLQLRVKDVDFGNRQLVIHSGKGNKDRLTVLPQSLVQPLQSFLHMRLVRHQLDMFEGIGLAPLPDRLRKKYPRAEREFRWQFVFASRVIRRVTGGTAPIAVCRTQSPGRPVRLESGRQLGRIRCVIVLPPIASQPGWTFGPCKHSWDTPT